MNFLKTLETIQNSFQGVFKVFKKFGKTSEVFENHRETLDVTGTVRKRLQELKSIGAYIYRIIKYHIRIDINKAFCYYIASF